MTNPMLAPTSESDLAECIATATGPLAISGGGTRGLKPEGTALSTAGLSGITLYEPGALTLVAQAGTPVAEIEAALAVENQMLAFEPMDHRSLLGTTGDPTIGGVVAANISGPRRVQAGACRDFLLGVRFVDGTGEIIKNGGRVMKNVTGYDLVKLMAGAHGTLGVLSEVSFKVLPRPEATGVLLLTGLTVADAVRAMSSALTSPYDVSGAAHIPEGQDGSPVTMIRLEGFENSVTYRAKQLKERLSQFGPSEIERRIDGPVSTTAGWRWVRDVETFAGTDEDVWRVSIKPSDAPALTATLKDARVMLDWGGGLVWVACLSGIDIRSKVPKGHATLVRASDQTRKQIATFHPEAPPLAKLAADLRKNFDPKGILNPGLMG